MGCVDGVDQTDLMNYLGMGWEVVSTIWYIGTRTSACSFSRSALVALSLASLSDFSRIAPGVYWWECGTALSGIILK